MNYTNTKYKKNIYKYKKNKIKKNTNNVHPKIWSLFIYPYVAVLNLIL